MQGEQPVATHEIPGTPESQNECFLCTLDPSKQPCARPQIEGRLIAIQEHMQEGERTAVVLLQSGTALVEVKLDGQYYRSLVKDIKMRNDVLNKLTLRIYHLPKPPEIRTNQKETRLCYTGNAYTLAVLEPDMLLNITDLNQAEYCARQYLLHRLSPSGSSPATIRGNLVHYCFKELLKAHDRGYFTSTEQETQSPLAFMQHHLERALQINNLDMALASVSDETMREEAAPHLESLARWFETERDTLWDMPGSYVEAQDELGDYSSGNQVRAETFLLAPEIGLRGRLDLFWQQTGRQRLLELKTGGAKGDLPKRDHRWQVYGYHALLSVRHNSQMKKAMATLLYSGTPGSAQAFGIHATIREIQRVNERRNTLIISRISAIPPAPPGVSRCSKCAMLTQCQNVSSLLQWQPPEVEQNGHAQPTLNGYAERIVHSEQNGYANKHPDRDFFVQASNNRHNSGKLQSPNASNAGAQLAG
jgi:DNA replication ATP-dependent helicase Dna2